MEAILPALDGVRHCGDYGIAWYNPRTLELWLVMGDSDGDTEEGYTSFEDIQALALTSPEVRKVLIADEQGPDTEGEADWIELGSFGTEWYEGKSYPRRQGRETG
jgi:hypothetical protein